MDKEKWFQGLHPGLRLGLNSYTEVQKTESFSAYKQAEKTWHLGHAAKAYTEKEHLISCASAFQIQVLIDHKPIRDKPQSVRGSWRND